ncbi:MAG: hypothetical protein IJW55_09850 [Clostridia bacterium]|nr:hypothetical protein [Clostridia bacterium]MBQ7348249.1 hypothetical protein [Clostridia bacterium]
MENILLDLFKSCLSQSYNEVENGGSFACERHGDTLYIWFEQSHGITDWLNNLRFAAAPYREMEPVWQCHAGFLKVWKSVKPYLEPSILDTSVKQICTVGYSHGAALAVLCHEFIWYRRPDLHQGMCGFGYGCPRVLFGCVPPEIAPRWDTFYVVRNLDDLVTHLPPRAAGYCHVGNLVTVGTAGKYSSIDAHRPESYLEELKNMEIH